jgi:hypothetical protein
MSSYYPSFKYMGLDSFKDKNLIVVHFESGDDGEVSTFLNMEPVYTENAYGTRRLDYGAKYTDVAIIRISVIKADGTDFTVAEVRDFLKWTTGARQNSYLDLVDGEVVKASFLGRITAVYQQKLDARTIGFVIEHTSVSPWAYSPQQFISCSFGSTLKIDADGVVGKDGQFLEIDENGVVSNTSGSGLSIEWDGIVYLENSFDLQIDNPSDDLYSYVYLDTTFTNRNGKQLCITNLTLDEETTIMGVRGGEIIKLHSGQFITSQLIASGSPPRIFGDDFNFVWPRLAAGRNEILVAGTGEGVVEFTYRYPIKIGDCAIDIGVSGASCNCGGSGNGGTSSGGSDVNSGYVSWDNIIGRPTTIRGYGITDTYTMAEINNKISNIETSVDGEELKKMLNKTLK